MNIILNNKDIDIPDTCKTVFDMLSSLDIDARGVAIAIGREVIPRADWHKEIIQEGVVVTLIRATQGG